MQATSAVRTIVALLACTALLTSCTGDGTTLDLLGDPLGPPVIRVTPGDFELSLIVGTSQAVSIEIENQGGLPLRVEEVSSPSAFITTDIAAAFNVSSGEIATVQAMITAGAPTTSPRAGLIRVTSNDPDAPTTSVPLQLVVTLRPVP